MIDSNAILQINTKNLIKNFKSIKKIAKKSICGATIKANAYGLGDKKIYKLLYLNGCRNFFVATLNEAINLRRKYKYGNIYVLNGVDVNKILFYSKQKIIPIINSIDEINIINKLIKSKVKIGIHLDTGINRLGIKIKEISKLNLKKFDIQILLSHLASSEEIANKYNNFQNNLFKKTFIKFKNIKYKSLANSMGIILGKKYHHDLIRPGIAIYGGHYNTKMKKYIKPVIKLKAKILQIKNLEKNEYVGYNQTFKTSKKTTVAILEIGYGDGIFRILSNKGYVYYKRTKFKIIGRISMDTLTIDITKKSKLIKKGMYLELINYTHDIEKIAKQCNTISNEILTSISDRVKRIYI